MTVPHLMNCPHTDSGWCTECVAELGNENWRQRDEIAALRKDAERYRWARENPITIDDFSFYFDVEVESFIDAQILAGRSVGAA